MNQEIIDKAEQFPYMESVQDYGETLTIRLKDFCRVVDIDALREFWTIDSKLTISYNRSTNSIVIGSDFVSR